MTNADKIDFTRVNNDVNGNPRLVVHFFKLLTKKELDSNLLPTGIKYDIALMRAKTVGGKKYHNKSYGGGIVFKEYESCLDGTVTRAFESFDQSKIFNAALAQIVLTVVNSQDTYTKALDLCKIMKKGIMYSDRAFAEIVSVCSDTSTTLRKKHGLRVIASAVWIAAVYVVLRLEEEEALEQSSKG